MKKKRFIMLVMLACGCLLQAQTPQPQQQQTPPPPLQLAIFDAFEQPPKPGEGKVIIHQSEKLKLLIGTRVDSKNIAISNGKTYLKAPGFRIHAYSSNTRSSKKEASDKGEEIKKLYAETGTYVIYTAPFWKLFIGDYRTFEEASVMMRDLQAKFPALKNEMYIVESDEIYLPME